MLCNAKTLLAVSLLLVGCGDSSGKSDNAAGEFDTGINNVEDTDDTDTDTDSDPVALFWSLDGDLIVDTNNDVDTLASIINVGFWSHDTLVCTTTLSIDNAKSQTLDDPDITLFTWWRLTLSEAGSACAPYSPPAVVNLGIGAMDPRLVPALDVRGLSGDTLYALYLQKQTSSGEPVFVYGVAGTTEHFDGTATPVAAAPIEQGNYDLRGLHLLPLGL